MIIWPCKRLGVEPAFVRQWLADEIGRVVVLVARDPEAQINLMLDGTGDLLEGLSPVSGPMRVAANRDIRIVPVTSFTVGYLLFNQRAYGERPAHRSCDVAVRRII
jgi:hypothetical protein